jgi:hypothetical protein
MARRIAKADLPVKTCAVCVRPFSWRKKWSKVWDDVRYCSDACRRQRNGKMIARMDGSPGRSPEG